MRLIPFRRRRKNAITPEANEVRRFSVKSGKSSAKQQDETQKKTAPCDDVISLGNQTPNDKPSKDTTAPTEVAAPPSLPQPQQSKQPSSNDEAETIVSITDHLQKRYGKQANDIASRTREQFETLRHVSLLDDDSIDSSCSSQRRQDQCHMVPDFVGVCRQQPA
eukprot:CAMPEP_0198117536 /NCGR_PEP_ID=MMETSP1442-20131203/18491_1 /TAXON_ID= /ORGANISM="Craspedostauros australis, Strain CCMP3328" /LENGTH=163 /DNA_ID=CAMNT_0043775605 /DNA_START=277 /DNA_END=768 /DNA_ORIENTATION=+